MNRLILKKLVFVGTDKEPAIVEFEAGFNVVSGPSDTGKSLIFECLQYVLGGGSRPKEPPEARGYTNLFLTIAAGDSEFTIERSVLSPDVKVYEAHFDDITEETESKELSSSAQAKENISDYLLDIVGIKDKRLKKNERNQTISLTFNVLRNLLLINEGKIQSTGSPILTGIPTSATSEKALFRFMLTGIDYSNVIVKQNPAIRKADANARINLLSHMIKNSSLNINKDVTKEELEGQLERLEASVENAITKISDSDQEIEELQEERKAAWEKHVAADSKIDQVKEIIDRFNLLKEHYQTDLDRLEAIIETGETLSLCAGMYCPICGAEPEYHRPECVISDQEIDSIRASCDYEKKKILSLQSDLIETINQMEAELKGQQDTKKNEQEKYQKIDNLLDSMLEPSVTKLRANLRRLFDTKKDVEIMISVMGQIEEMEQLKATAEEDLKPQPKKEKAPAGVQAAEVNELLKVIEDTLADWGYPGLDRMGFSEDQQDITIGSKNRADQGKGYRAITHAAFMISLMEFCVDNDRPHPGFVVLDSPLVTFRGTDKTIDPSEAISDDVKRGFYKSLSSLRSDRQIIVIENDDPPQEVQSKINYVEFTKDIIQGRYGFIPMN